jgi:hypothetical protein
MKLTTHDELNTYLFNLSLYGDVFLTVNFHHPVLLKKIHYCELQSLTITLGMSTNKRVTFLFDGRTFGVEALGLPSQIKSIEPAASDKIAGIPRAKLPIAHELKYNELIHN